MATQKWKVYGGDLIDPSSTEFRKPDEVHHVGVFDTYDEAYDAWKAEAQQTVDNAHRRYFIEAITTLDT